MSATVIKHGLYSIVQGEVKESFDPFKGYIIETSYEGDEAAIRDQMSVLAAQFWSCQMTLRTSALSGQNHATLTVQKALDTILPQPVWSINGIKVEKNLFDCKELYFVHGLTSETKNGIEYRIKNPTSKKPLTTSHLSEDESINAEILLSLLQTGVEAKRISSVEVKRTIVVPSQYTPSWNLQFVDQIISRATLINLFLAPFYIQPLLPPSDSILFDDKSGLSSIAGYLVDQPNYETIDNGKRVSVSQVFTWDVWSVLPYGIYTFAG